MIRFPDGVCREVQRECWCCAATVKPTYTRPDKKCKCCMSTRTLEFNELRFEARMLQCLFCKAEEISWTSVLGIKGELCWCKEKLCGCEKQEQVSECLKESAASVLQSGRDVLDKCFSYQR